jgi:hypothetical protein
LESLKLRGKKDDKRRTTNYKLEIKNLIFEKIRT